MLSLNAVPPSDVPLFWPLCAPRVDEALSHANSAVLAEDFLKLINERQLLLVLISNGPDWIGEVVLEKVIYPRRMRLRICTLSGKDLFPRLPELAGILREFSRLVGCNGLEALVRPGLARELVKLFPGARTMTWMCSDDG